MCRAKEIEKEFEAIINRFSEFIKIHIHKFNVQKYGIEIDDISQDSFSKNIRAQNVQTQIKEMYKPTSTRVETEKPHDIHQIKVSTADATRTIKGVRKKRGPKY